jgi:hypothetical protein
MHAPKYADSEGDAILRRAWDNLDIEEGMVSIIVRHREALATEMNEAVP